MTEKIFNPTIDEDLYLEIRILTLKLKLYLLHQLLILQTLLKY